MNIVLCESAGKREYTAGNKARTDAVRILQDIGYTHIPLYVSKSNKILVFFQLIFNTLKAICLANRDDTVFIQYPYRPKQVNKLLMNVLSLGRSVKKYRIVLLIHDSEGLRSYYDNPKVLKEEIVLFNKADMVICHNEIMKQTFLDAGGRHNYTVLGPFDYLYDGQLAKTVYSQKPTIIVAGNLSSEKSGYVYKLQQLKNCSFNLYGINYSGETNDHVRYKGSFHPDELIEHLQGSFGLVWDGDSLETCDGSTGNYLKFNNPHKFSLYIAAGIPLIVWRESAISSIVREYDLGICVENLQEIESLDISYNSYLRKKENVLNLRKNLVNGNNLKNAIKNINL